MTSTKIFQFHTYPFVNLFGGVCKFSVFLYISGQLIVASLLNRNIKSRLLVRDPEKAIDLFGKQDEEILQVAAF
jgi:hypothetical protein